MAVINVLVFDDSPPGAPVYVEGDLPEGMTRTRAHELLADMATQAGYKIETYMWTGWDDNEEGRFRVIHEGAPDPYDDRRDNAAHHAFLDKLVKVYDGKTLEGHRISAYAES